MSRIYSQNDLKRLPRAEIQSLARREHIKANGKSVDIISQLALRYPHGVPMDLPLPSEPAPPAPTADTTSPGVRVKRESMSLTSTRPAAIGGDANLNSGEAPPVEAAEVLQPSSPPIGLALKKLNKGPSIREIRNIKYNLINHVDTDHQLRRQIADSEILLARSFDILEQATHDLDQVVCLRAGWESQLLGPWKSDGAFYDGTGVYPPGPDKEMWDTWQAMRIIEEEEEQKRIVNDLEEEARRVRNESRQAEIYSQLMGQTRAPQAEKSIERQ